MEHTSENWENSDSAQRIAKVFGVETIMEVFQFFDESPIEKLESHGIDQKTGIELVKFMLSSLINSTEKDAEDELIELDPVVFGLGMIVVGITLKERSLGAQ